MVRSTPSELIVKALERRPAALGRVLSIVEQGGSGARDIAAAAFPASGNAYTVGITGPPGAGKSTLTTRLVSTLRARSECIAVLAIDPTSPYSGGALLGDRVRMLEHSRDPGVFIRSMASRGHLGGLATATPEALRVLDAGGFGWILLETVGVGQAELDVASFVDTTIVVVNPGWGDDVQAAKAGLLEIADIFVINKADRPGVGETRRHLDEILAIREGTERGWTPPIIEMIASEGVGVDDLLCAVIDHRHRLVREDALDTARAERLWREVEVIFALRMTARAHELLGRRRFTELRERLAARELDPWTAADRLIGGQ